MRNFLEFYFDKFRKLKRGMTPNGLAPHKPILLLATIKTVLHDGQQINCFSPESLLTNFRMLWTSLTGTTKYPDIMTPFTKLSSEGFWHVDIDYNSQEKVAYLDSELFDYMTISKGSQALTSVILEAYFGDKREKWDEVKNLVLQNDYPAIPAEYPIEEIRKTGDFVTENAKKHHEALHSIPYATENSEDFDEIEKIGITPSCLQVLRRHNLKTIDDFLNFDLNLLRKETGIGIGKITFLSKKQKYQNERQKKVPLQVDISVDELDLPPSCKLALQELNIKNIDSFCNFDANALGKVSGVGSQKIRIIKQLQQKLRAKYDINDECLDSSTQRLDGIVRSASKETNQNECSDDKIKIQYTNVPFLSKTVGDIFTFDPKIRQIGDLHFTSAVNRLLEYRSIYETDEIYVLLSTTIEYFFICLQEKISDFWKTQLKESKEIKIATFQIAETSFVAERNCLIPKKLASDEFNTILNKKKIYDFNGYEKFITKSHSVSDIASLSFAYYHRQKYTDFKSYFDALKRLKCDDIIKILFKNSDQRSREIYLARYCQKKTLDDVAWKFRLTRERVRQITKGLDQSLRYCYSSDENYFTAAKALSLFIDTLIMSMNGIATADYIQKELFDFFGWKKNILGFLEHFIAMFCERFVCDDGVFVSKDYPCLSCRKIKMQIKKSVIEKSTVSLNELSPAIEKHCSHCIWGHKNNNDRKVFLTFFCKKNMENEIIPNDGILYKKSEYTLRFGSGKKSVEMLFTNKKILSIDEIVSALSKYRPDMSERKAHAFIHNADVVLADRGKYMLRKSLPKISAEVMADIIRDINNRISRNPHGLYSLKITVKKFKKELKAVDCFSPYMLFELLKQKKPRGIRFIKCPYVTSNTNNERFSISDLLEDYVNERGIVSLSDARKYFMKELGVSAPVFTGAYNNSDCLLVDDDNNLRSIDELSIDKKALLPFDKQLRKLGNADSITVRKLFDDNKATCLMLNISGPKLLFNILRIFDADNFSFRYPQIARSKENFVAIKTMLIDYIRESQSFCTAEQLGEFCRSKNFTEHNIYLTHAEHPNIFRYLPGAWVHVDTLGWDTSWMKKICDVAKTVLEESNSPGNSYGFQESICDKEDELPELQNGLWWTSTLIGDILEASDRFLVYGKNKSVFSPKGAPNKLNNFGDLCALLLDDAFEGAANLHDFSAFLRERNLISHSDLNDSILQGSKRITISGQEIYTVKETRNA